MRDQTSSIEAPHIMAAPSHRALRDRRRAIVSTTPDAVSCQPNAIALAPTGAAFGMTWRLVLEVARLAVCMAWPMPMAGDHLEEKARECAR